MKRVFGWALKIIVSTALMLVMGTTMAMADFFDALETTIQHHGSGLEQTSRPLGLALSKSQTKSNEFFDVLTSERSQTFPELKSAEIRVNRRSGKVHLILLDVDARAICITDSEILRRFGSRPELSPPTTRQPEGALLYYNYRQPWGDLRVGLSQKGQRCVERIVTEFSN